MTINPDDFGKSFKGFMDQMSQSIEPEHSFKDKIAEHFGKDPSKFPSLSEKFENFEHPNIQLAFDQFLSDPGVSHELTGLTTGSEYLKASLADLVSGATTGSMMGASGAVEGPVKYKTIKLDEDNIVTCVSCGVYLINDNGSGLVVHVQGGQESGFGRDSQIQIEVMAETRDKAERFLATLRTHLRNKNVYKGHVISVSQDFWDL